MLVCDFLTVETCFPQALRAVAISLATPRIEYIASPPNPDGRWVTQQARTPPCSSGDVEMMAKGKLRRVILLTTQDLNGTSSGVGEGGACLDGRLGRARNARRSKFVTLAAISPEEQADSR
jgi:hypothetical protein